MDGLGFGWKWQLVSWQEVLLAVGISLMEMITPQQNFTQERFRQALSHS
jgi:hypothetical protein